MLWTAFSFGNNFARSSRNFGASALLVALAGCEVQPPNDTYPDVNGVFSCSCDGCVNWDNDDANGCETNIKTDEDNCGACGVMCTSPHTCVKGTCGFDNTNCPGVDLATHIFNCGACNVSADDGNPCTEDSCINGVPIHKNDPEGSWCQIGACDANGQCIRFIGKACSSNAQCKSGICTDGVCCDRTCDGTCESCKKAETGFEDGTCWPILDLTDPANECPTGECNGVGQCIVSTFTCATSADCTSGFCADGYCCDSPCTESCMTCNAPNNLGSCIPIAIFDDDPNASSPCSGPQVACNGSGVCKGDLGQTCATNADCLSGHCDGGVCGFTITQPGPLVWEWHQDDSSIADPMLAYTYREIDVSDMVAMHDGSIRVVGPYLNSTFGMFSGTYDYHYGNTTSYTHNYLGPHLFVFNLDASAQTGTFGTIFYRVDLFDKLGISDYSHLRSYPKGLQLWLTGGYAGGYFEDWVDKGNTKLFTKSNECTSGWFSVSGPSSWSLGGAGACALQAWTIAGDDGGNTFARSAAGISHYDQTGQFVQILPDPFTGPEGKLAIGPQGEFYLGARTSSEIRLAKADALGTLQWTKSLANPLVQGANDCFSSALDAAGNVLLAFHSEAVVDLGNGPLQQLGPRDLILAKLDSQGTPIWAKRFGGPGFTTKSCSLRRTGLDELALVLDSTGNVDLGDGVIPSGPVLMKFDALGSLLWRADLQSLFPFVLEAHTWGLSGHPSGAVFVGGSGHEPTPPSSFTQRALRFVVAKYGP